MKTKKEIIVFNKTLYKKCKKELNKTEVRAIILKYKKHKTTIKYGPEFLSYYYSPTSTVLKQFFKTLKTKRY